MFNEVAFNKYPFSGFEFDYLVTWKTEDFLKALPRVCVMHLYVIMYVMGTRGSYLRCVLRTHLRYVCYSVGITQSLQTILSVSIRPCEWVCLSYVHTHFVSVLSDNLCRWGMSRNGWRS
eukprot:GHVR01125341.1.p1 GENE.GHVR01125341.1~~GHVR01125341.1.p1  ORF type:complete len:119 (-),score=11.71 GHVR01125341.1:564-920(-)